MTASVPGRASNHSAGNNDLVTWQMRLKLGERAFSVAAPRIRNRLPIEIRAARHSSLQTKIENAFVLGSLPAI